MSEQQLVGVDEQVKESSGVKVMVSLHRLHSLFDIVLDGTIIVPSMTFLPLSLALRTDDTVSGGVFSTCAAHRVHGGTAGEGYYPNIISHYQAAQYHAG